MNPGNEPAPSRHNEAVEEGRADGRQTSASLRPCWSSGEEIDAASPRGDFTKDGGCRGRGAEGEGEGVEGMRYVS